MKLSPIFRASVTAGAFVLAAAALDVATSNPAFAAGLDCAKAVSRVEKMICTTPTLSERDSTLNRLYGWVLAGANAVNKPKLTADQKSWIAQTRDVCSSVGCLTDAYDARVNQLATIKIDDKDAASYVSDPDVIARITKEIQKDMRDVGITQPVGTCSHILSLASHPNSHGAFCSLGNRKIEVCEENMFGNLAVNFSFEESGPALAAFTQVACPGG